MARVLHYFAQPFFSGRPVAARYPFVCAVEAEEGGRLLMAGGAAGVLVYQQWGDTDLALFDEPEILAVMGDVPSGARQIDADGRDPWLDDLPAEAA